MQTFKQIPYQNYIELKFNNKNIHQAEKQQALIKYKRNSQLLAEIFSFKAPTQQPKSQNSSTEPIITQQLLTQYRQQIELQKQKGQQQCDKIKQNNQLYEQTIKSISQIKTKDQLMNKIQQLKALNLYDEKHPFFVEGSPFFLNPTDEQILQVVNQSEMVQQTDIWDRLNLLEQQP